MDVRKIVEALEKGATLLGDHCEKCGAPLIKQNDRVFCVYCEEKKEEETKGDEGERVITLEEILNESAQTLMAALREEKDPQKIYQILLALEKLLDLLERVKSL